MYIRYALDRDLDGIADCAERFFDYARYDKKDLTLDRESFKAMVSKAIKGKEGIVLLLMSKWRVVGGICGVVTDWGFNVNIKPCVELFYWVDENYRGGRESLRLFEEYERRAAELGATHSLMISVDTDLQKKVNRLYKKRGYKDLEQSFIKAL